MAQKVMYEKFGPETLVCRKNTNNYAIKMIDLTAMRTMSENEEQKITLKTLQNRLADAEDELLEAENIRKELHNTIMELKGNIRVFCRVRPSLSGSDCNSRECVVVSFPTSMELRGRGIELMHNSKSIAFTYDKVFNPESSQEDIFIEISQLVQSALDGYKVCIFAYGQTGSGKTYTMMGTTEKRGLIPRSLEQIFETSQSKLSQGWKYKMQASMLEIYNETIRDLLASSQSGSLDIKHDANSNSYVPGLTVVDVCSINEVSFLLRQAAQSRDKRIGIRASVLEEKATACNMLCCYVDELKEGFYPWIDQVAPTLEPLLKFYFHEEIRKAAVSVLGVHFCL